MLKKLVAQFKISNSTFAEPKRLTGSSPAPAAKAAPAREEMPELNISLDFDPNDKY